MKTDHSSPHEILTNVATNIVETKPGKEELIQKTPLLSHREIRGIP
jgi:hypothetical protein